MGEWAIFIQKVAKNKVGLGKQLVSKHNHLEVQGISCFASTTWPCEKYWFLLILLLASSGSITVWVVLSQSWDDFPLLTVEDFQVDTLSVRKMSDLPRCGERGFGVQKQEQVQRTWGRDLRPEQMTLGEVKRGSVWLEDNSREILREAGWGHDGTAQVDWL